MYSRTNLLAYYLSLSVSILLSWPSNSLAMSEATYTGGADPDPAPPAHSGSEGAQGTTSHHGSGGLTIDTTYPRSIEGILKLITVVRRSTIMWASRVGPLK